MSEPMQVWVFMQDGAGHISKISPQLDHGEWPGLEMAARGN